MLTDTVTKLKQVKFQIKSLQGEGAFLIEQLRKEIDEEVAGLALLPKELLPAPAADAAPFRPKPAPLPVKVKPRATGKPAKKSLIRQIKTLRAEGKSVSAIAKITGVAWATADKYAAK